MESTMVTINSMNNPFLHRLTTKKGFRPISTDIPTVSTGRVLLETSTEYEEEWVKGHYDFRGNWIKGHFVKGRVLSKGKIIEECRALKRDKQPIFNDVRIVKEYGDKVTKYVHEYTASPSMRSRELAPISKERMEYVKERRRENKKRW